MTERIPLDDLTLDQLYDDLEFWKRLAQDAREAENRRTVERDERQTRAVQAEAAINRVQALCDRYQAWHDGGWAPADAALVAREYRTALDQAQQPTTTDTCVRRVNFTAAIGYPVRCPHCPPDAAPVPATHWTKHVQRHHSEQQLTT